MLRPEGKHSGGELRQTRVKNKILLMEDPQKKNIMGPANRDGVTKIQTKQFFNLIYSMVC